MYKLILKILMVCIFCGDVLAKEPPKKASKESTIKQESKISSKKFIIKSIQINQDYEDFINLDIIKNSPNFKCETNNSFCTFENSILGINADFGVFFTNNKVSEIRVIAKSQRPAVDPAFLGDQLRDYLDSEYGNAEAASDDFDIAAWMNKYYKIIFTYSCLKDNLNEPEFIKSGCIADSTRKINFAIQQSIMESGTLVQKINTYKWLTKEESIIYEKTRGRFHKKLSPIYKSINYNYQGNWDILIISKRGNSDVSIIKDRLKTLFSDNYFDDLHGLMEKDTGVQIRPSKIKKNDF